MQVIVLPFFILICETTQNKHDIYIKNHNKKEKPHIIDLFLVNLQLKSKLTQ